ncbi:alpha/beta hydrolase [Actinomycetospora cinnamomea]|uniref:S-formylglutathione hydrolase FrmB n=1 Tax=Actinomycetospora cinnamomea TaxID=663609 RepID=A0A2U1FBH7_9PSEU|nr:alpha/beta hydrolase-fold protein [Actinomycetospora cinnamomea]PVZ09528.1 S-formylglutathione hydrolase FrmB [Actinomycetospora cinnamomea]
MTVRGVAEIDITTDSFLGALALLALVVVLVLVLVLRTRLGRFTRLGRALVVLVTTVLVLVGAGAGINAHFDYFRTLGDVMGLPPSDEVELAALLERTDRPAQGVVTTTDLPGRRSGFEARPATVYVPPAWFARPRPELPVVVLLHGTPGTPQDWLDGGQAAATADAYAAAHGGTAPVLVMPDVNGILDADSECVDGPAGRVETYLTVDVPAFVQQVFHTAAPGRAWAVAGLSEGGSCSLMLALRHPGTFATFGDYAGLAGPRAGDTNADTASAITQLFGGSAQAFAAHEPADLMAQRPFPELGGWFEVGDADPEPYAAYQALEPAARRAGITTCGVVVPGGGHTFAVFAQAFSDSLPWIAGRVGAGPPVTSCPSASS